MSDRVEAPPLTVLYDDACGLCRRLAEYGRTRSEGRLRFVAWHVFAKTEEAAVHFDELERAAPPSRLRALADGRVVEDAAAWAAILAAYPPFQQFAWIAQRLGLLGAVSQATYYGAQWLRRGCGSCP